MSYVIAIPSYNRVDILEKKTLKVLNEYAIPPSKIHIFVANEAEKKAYEAIPNHLYGKIVIGKPGLQAQRNFIFDYFPKGTHLISLDDDINSVVHAEGTKLKPLESLAEVFAKGFAECKKHKYHLWGVYPMANAGWQTKQADVSTDTKFIIGHMFGLIVDKTFKLHVELKQDYELSLHYSKQDGGVIRLNHIACRTKMGAKGGIGKATSERLGIYQKSIQYLMEKYPDRVRLNPRREGEILLKNPPT